MRTIKSHFFYEVLHIFDAVSALELFRTFVLKHIWFILIPAFKSLEQELVQKSPLWWFLHSVLPMAVLEPLLGFDALPQNP